MPDTLRKDIFILENKIPSGYYQLYKNRLLNPKFYFGNIIVLKTADESYNPVGIDYIIVNEALYNTISSGDIASITQGKLRVILSRNANHNTLLVTERCNNLCEFCSQPPKLGMDDWLLDISKQALAAFNFEGVIGISGGEPLIYGNDFIDFLVFTKNNTPQTVLHILTNGRAFHDLAFTKQVAKVVSDMTISFGIPLYSVLAKTHNQLVGNTRAYDETISGIINAGNSGVNIELRFIPTKLNYQDLYSVVEMAGRVFSNINQLSIMNLEATGWAKKNWSQLYIEPESYQNLLISAIEMAERSQLPIVLFNYPLCHLPPELWKYSVQSISDWKNHYPEECKNCRMVDKCGGYFSSSYGKYHQSPKAVL